MEKKELKIISEVEGQRMDTNMSPSERMKKGFELSEWAIKLNKFHREELLTSLKNNYVLE